MLYLHLHDITVLQPYRLWLHAECNSGGRACHYDSASFQCCALTDESNDLFDVEQQVVGVGVLPGLSVHEGLYSKIAGIANKLWGRHHRTKRRILVEPFAEA